MEFIKVLQDEVDSISDGFCVQLPPTLRSQQDFFRQDSLKFCEFSYHDSQHLLKHQFSSDLLIKQSTVATSVNDYQTLERLRALKVPLFVGHFLESQTNDANKSPSPEVKNFVTLLNELAVKDYPETMVLSFFSHNSILCDQLLRMINKPLFKEVNKVDSLHEALSFFGVNALKKWALMLSLCDLTDKPLALIQIALQRALMCQMLAELQGHTNTSCFFISGILSTLEAFLDYPIEKILADTKLPHALKAAVIDKKGAMGKILAKVRSYQRGQLLNNNAKISQCYLQCSRQTIDTLQAIGLATTKQTKTS